MPQFAFQGQEMHSKEAFDQLDAIFHCPIALRLMGLRFLFENANLELGQDQVSQRKDRRLIVGLDDDLISEPKAADAFGGAFCGGSLVKDCAPAGYHPGLDGTALALFENSTVMTSVSSALLRKQ